jgi:2'-5' RNA ligase
MSVPAKETALVVLVPEAEPLVERFRERHDPSAAEGVPAHITIIYPFKPPQEVSEVVLGRLRELLSGFAPFDLVLGKVRRFRSGVLYLAPADPQPFRRLTIAVWNAFPEAPPYGGRHPQVTPHLTVAQIAAADAFDAVAAEFARASRGRLPVRVRVAGIALMDNASGRWQVKTTLPLGGQESNAIDNPKQRWSR